MPSYLRSARTQFNELTRSMSKAEHLSRIFHRWFPFLKYTQSMQKSAWSKFLNPDPVFEALCMILLDYGQKRFIAILSCRDEIFPICYCLLKRVKTSLSEKIFLPTKKGTKYIFYKNRRSYIGQTSNLYFSFNALNNGLRFPVLTWWLLLGE